MVGREDREIIIMLYICFLVYAIHGLKYGSCYNISAARIEDLTTDKSIQNIKGVKCKSNQNIGRQSLKAGEKKMRCVFLQKDTAFSMPTRFNCSLSLGGKSRRSVFFQKITRVCECFSGGKHDNEFFSPF